VTALFNFVAGRRYIVDCLAIDAITAVLIVLHNGGLLT